MQNTLSCFNKSLFLTELWSWKGPEIEEQTVFSRSNLLLNSKILPNTRATSRDGYSECGYTKATGDTCIFSTLRWGVYDVTWRHNLPPLDFLVAILDFLLTVKSYFEKFNNDSNKFFRIAHSAGMAYSFSTWLYQYIFGKYSRRQVLPWIEMLGKSCQPIINTIIQVLLYLFKGYQHSVCWSWLVLSSRFRYQFIYCTLWKLIAPSFAEKLDRESILWGVWEMKIIAQ